MSDAQASQSRRNRDDAHCRDRRCCRCRCCRCRCRCCRCRCWRRCWRGRDPRSCTADCCTAAGTAGGTAAGGTAACVALAAEPAAELAECPSAVPSQPNVLLHVEHLPCSRLPCSPAAGLALALASRASGFNRRAARLSWCSTVDCLVGPTASRCRLACTSSLHSAVRYAARLQFDLAPGELLRLCVTLTTCECLVCDSCLGCVGRVVMSVDLCTLW